MDRPIAYSRGCRQSRLHAKLLDGVELATAPISRFAGNGYNPRDLLLGARRSVGVKTKFY